MIAEGFKLTVIGMLVVFLFLFILVFVVRISALLLKPYTEQEAKLQARDRRRSSARKLLSDDRLMAVIGAAVSAHRKRTQR